MIDKLNGARPDVRANEQANGEADSASKDNRGGELGKLADYAQSLPERILDDSALIELAEFFKTFGDSTRVRLIAALLHEELCVCDLASLLNTSDSAVSHQLRILRAAKIVRTRRAGKQIFYALDDEHVGMIFACGLEHITEKNADSRCARRT